MEIGKFIALEGIEGAGKSTQRDYMQGYLQDAGFEVVMTREPGGTPLAEIIRELLKKPHEEEFTPKAEAMLFFAAREQHLDQVIRPALARGAIVLCDRFVDSTYAYQAAGGKVDRKFIEVLDEIIVGDTKPDMTFIFKVDPLVGLARAGKRGELDRMDSKGEAYYTCAQDEFLRMAAEAPARYTVIDANVSQQQVSAQLMPAMMTLVNSMRSRANIIPR